MDPAEVIALIICCAEDEDAAETRHTANRALACWYRVGGYRPTIADVAVVILRQTGAVMTGAQQAQAGVCCAVGGKP